MRFDIDPQKGLKTLNFGASRQEASQLFGEKSYSQRAVPWDKEESDYFNEIGVRVSFSSGEVSNINLQGPASVFLFERKIDFGSTLAKVSKLLRDLKVSSKKNGNDVFSDEIGVNFIFDRRKLAAFELYNGDFFSLAAQEKINMDRYYDDLTGPV